MKPRLTTELDELTRRLLAMPLVDRYAFAERVETVVNLDQPLLKDEAQARKDTLDCLRKAAAHLGVTRPLTKDEYRAAQQELGLPRSWQQIFRLWRSFELAAQSAAGAPLPPTWQQRDFQRRFLAGKQARSYEEYFAAVRLWLDSRPMAITASGYDEFTHQHNLTVEDGGLPLPRLATITTVLGLRFGDVVAIACGERDYEDVLVQEREGADWSRGEHDLVGRRTVALLAGVTQGGAHRLTHKADFPAPVLRVLNRRGWLRQEVVDYLAGARPPRGAEDRLRDEYLSTAEAAETLGLKPTTLILTETYPRPVAQIANLLLWPRAEVEAYARANAKEIEKRRRLPKTPVRRNNPSSEFLTVSTLAAELEIGNEQADRLTRQAAFPQPVKRFGGGGVWSRADVAAYFNGQPQAPSALGELLMDAGEMTEFMALKPGVGRHRYRDMPAPVARIKTGNVYLRSEVEARLAADPAARARLDRRRARRQASAPSSTSSQASVSSGDG